MSHSAASPLSALVLAGSRPGPPDPVAQAEAVSHKALVTIAGKPMLEHVVSALRGAGIARIAVSASDEAVRDLATSLGCEVLPTGTGPSASVAIGLQHLGTPLLVTTSDHALLQPGWVFDFLQDAPPASDVAILLATRPLVQAAMPGSRRTYMRFADGHWSGCNLFLLATPAAGRAIDTWKMVEVDRKRPWRIAARLGLGMLGAYALGRLTLAGAIGRLGQRIGVSASLVPARDGLAAVDVDKPADLADVRAIMGTPAD